MKKITTLIISILLVFIGLIGCSDTDSDSDSNLGTATPIIIDDNDGEDYNPVIDPANFVSTIDNPYFTLTAGRIWSYEGVDEDGEKETVREEVTNESKTILGIPMTVIHAQEWDEDNELIEDTYDWYAQDKDGNVWYFGEDSTEYDDGKSSKEGSWEAGVDGAQPGIIMKANPQIGDVYRQEFLKGEAEDMGEILSVNETVTIGLGTYENCLVIKDWNPLEPEVEEHKYWCPAAGNVVLEKKVAGEAGEVELVEMQ